MLVAASSECYEGEPLETAVERLVDLEYTNIEVAIHAGGGQMSPTEVVNEFDRCVDRCLNTRRLNVVAYSVGIDAEGDDYYQQFHAICRLAKATLGDRTSVEWDSLGEDYDRIREHIDNRLLFLILLNLFLLAVGCMIDMFSALVVGVPAQGRCAVGLLGVGDQ